jgi:hypothetical protein
MQNNIVRNTYVIIHIYIYIYAVYIYIYIYIYVIRINNCLPLSLESSSVDSGVSGGCLPFTHFRGCPLSHIQQHFFPLTPVLAVQFLWRVDERET